MNLISAPRSEIRRVTVPGIPARRSKVVSPTSTRILPAPDNNTRPLPGAWTVCKPSPTRRAITSPSVIISPALTWIKFWAASERRPSMRATSISRCSSPNLASATTSSGLTFCSIRTVIRPGTGSRRSRRTVVSGRICATGASIADLASYRPQPFFNDIAPPGSIGREA